MNERLPSYKCEFLGEFPDRTDAFLWTLAREYYRRTEEYDRSICTGGMRHGEAMPGTPDESRSSNQNAHYVLRELERRAECEGHSRKALQDAMHGYCKSGWYDRDLQTGWKNNA